jgi:DNA-binding transcriptional LysR family regulator
MPEMNKLDGMSAPLSLDPDLLRVFVLIAEGRSFTRAAAIVGRTQSAVSMQVKRLEEVLGQPVLQRGKGGRVDLTSYGQFLLGRARQMLALNDEVIATFRAPAIAGRVRLGTPDDYVYRFLPPVLVRFAETHPAVEVDVLCADSAELVHRMQAGELDLTLISDGHQLPGWSFTPLWNGPLRWITCARGSPHRQTPLPLALAREAVDGPRRSGCTWFGSAIAALEREGRPYRIAYTSDSQAGTHVPVLAGLAITVSALAWLPEGLRPLRADEGFPALPNFGIVLMRPSQSMAPAAAALAARIEESFRAEAAQVAQPQAAAE